MLHTFFSIIHTQCLQQMRHRSIYIYSRIGFVGNADGTVTRVSEISPTTAASSDPTNPVLTKDVPINQENNTWARLYLPRQDSGAAAPTTKLPVIVYYHGSGFIVSSAATTSYQKFCSDIVLEIPIVMVSVEYRLAQEHRLPAAYDDGEEALHWLAAKASEDEWLTKYADLSKCYLMGTSAGATIAYHVALRVASRVDPLTPPLKVRGIILHHSFFGGVERTPSEIRLANDERFSLSMSDLCWTLALPVGVDRDHEYCNAMKGMRVDILEKMKIEGWRFLVTGCDGDLLIDRQIELAKLLKENGMNVIEDFSEGGHHGIEILDESKARILCGLIKKFVLTSS